MHSIGFTQLAQVNNEPVTFFHPFHGYSGDQHEHMKTPTARSEHEDQTGAHYHIIGSESRSKERMWVCPVRAHL